MRQSSRGHVVTWISVIPTTCLAVKIQEVKQGKYGGRLGQFAWEIREHTRRTQGKLKRSRRQSKDE